MNLSNFITATAIALLFSLNNKEIANYSSLGLNILNTTTGNTQGGPRTVIQAMTEVVVIQPTATNLYISIVNSEGTIVVDQVTQCLQTSISTVGLKKGVYIVKTVDDYENVQVFTISI